ncbi:helix-turn-helix domain-containing protein [Streptomyces sp. M10(2022)]
MVLTTADREALVRMTTTGFIRPRRSGGPAFCWRWIPPPARSTRRTRSRPGRGLGETLRLVAKRFAETGEDVWATVARKKRELPPVPSPMTGEVKARLIALARSSPPAGHARWSLRLLEKHVALLEDIPDLDHSTIGRVLKKRNCILI